MPPLNRLRKSVVFFAFLLFCFILYRLFFFKTDTADTSPPEENVQDISTEICLLVVSGGPVNVDTVFNLKNGINKIFAYSSWGVGFNLSDTLWHIWYYGDEPIKRIECKVENSACFSFISADSLEEGRWSIDTRQNDILVSVKQFRIVQK